MKKRILRSLIVLSMLGGMLKEAKLDNYNCQVKECSITAGACDVIYDFSTIEVASNDVVIVAEHMPMPTEKDSELYLSYKRMGYSDEKFYSDLDLLAAITMAEAGNQSELGKRLVIDTVLNRIDSCNWRDDDTIWEVIAHPYQYETYTTGAYTRVDTDDYIYQLVVDELLNRTDYQVIYFKTNGYHTGVPSLYPEGDHYFSGDYER